MPPSPRSILDRVQACKLEHVQQLAMRRPPSVISLDGYNASNYSLFGSDESLMQTLAVREYVLRAALIPLSAPRLLRPLSSFSAATRNLRLRSSPVTNSA